jgi:hypothetical protein
MTRAEKNIWQSTPTFELLGIGQNGLIPTKQPTAKTDGGLMPENSRGDWTPLELFVAGVRGWEGHLRKQVRNGSPFLE